MVDDTDNSVSHIAKDKVRKQDPLHAITLKTIVTELHEKYGWEMLAQKINIKCFTNDPSINSSLKFLRKTQWARNKVEQLYLNSIKNHS